MPGFHHSLRWSHYTDKPLLPVPEHSPLLRKAGRCPSKEARDGIYPPVLSWYPASISGISGSRSATGPFLRYSRTGYVPGLHGKNPDTPDRYRHKELLYKGRSCQSIYLHTTRKRKPPDAPSVRRASDIYQPPPSTGSRYPFPARY